MELRFNDITILRYALSGIVVFQGKTTLTMLSFHVIAYLTFVFLFNGKSLFGTTRLAGGFRESSSFVGVLYTKRANRLQTEIC